MGPAHSWHAMCARVSHVVGKLDWHNERGVILPFAISDHEGVLSLTLSLTAHGSDACLGVRCTGRYRYMYILDDCSCTRSLRLLRNT